MNVSSRQCEVLRADFTAALRRARAPRLRPLGIFAEQEIICPPSSPRRNEPFTFDTQPFVRLLYELMESERFPRIAITGPTQTGKTFTALVIPAMWHLFEREENCIYAIPTMKMSRDKWEKDLKPVILASRYAHLMPKEGAGSKGGSQLESITFQNGATLKFMSAKGGDENRSGFTARVLLATEIDKYDENAEASREADPVTQMLERLGAFEVMQTKVYLECTVSIEQGRIWQEYTRGSEGRIVLPCPHCRAWVTLEREHLIGWQDAEDELTARENALFACSACGEPWTELQRLRANQKAKLIHRGQTIDTDGVIHGHLPRTLTAGFRWSAVNNLFKPAADVAAREWQAKYSPDEDNNEKAMCQFVWAKPYKPIAQGAPISLTGLLSREHEEGRGIVPAAAESITVGIDLGGWWCHWTAIAWGQRARGWIVDYGRIAVPQATLGLEAGLLEALREFRELCDCGWRKSSGEQLTPEECLVDSGWKTPLVYDFIRDSGFPYRPCKGLSVAGEPVSYNRPKSTGAIVRWIGEGWHIARLRDDGIDLVEIDANGAKSTLHARLNSGLEGPGGAAPGALTMFRVDRSSPDQVEARRQFVRHLTAEEETTEFQKGRGMVTLWKKIRPANHHLDSTALAIIGGSIYGVEITPEEIAAAAPRTAPAPISQEIPRSADPHHHVEQRPVEQARPKAPVRSPSWLRRTS